MSSSTVRTAIRLVAVAGLLMAWALLLRPQWLGGSTAYVMVRGDSMVPSHHDGDLVVLALGDGYGVGDVVGYLIPPDEVGAGQLVVHRIVDTAPGGRFVIQGDNNELPDPWTPSESEMRGRVVVRVPYLGRLITTAMRPPTAGALAASLVVMIAVARGAPRGQAAGGGVGVVALLRSASRRRSAAR